MKTTFLFLFVVSFSFAQKEDEKYLNYLVAARNNSTFQFNLVINFKNQNTNETREICVEGERLVFAIVKEKGLEYDDYDKIDKIISENKLRYFEFKNPKAIEGLTGEIYSEKELQELEKKVDFDKLAKLAKANKEWEKSLGSAKLVAMYAHELFNRGVLTGQNGCFGGGTLEVVDRNNPY